MPEFANLNHFFWDARMLKRNYRYPAMLFYSQVDISYDLLTT
jgi:hypothetical protein